MTVEATDRLQPHLVDHTNALLLDGEEHAATWLVADVGKPDWPLSSVAAQQAYVAKREAEGWTEVFSRRAHGAAVPGLSSDGSTVTGHRGEPRHRVCEASAG